MLRIFGPRRDDVTGGWTELYNKELHNLYSSPSKIGMIKSTIVGWASHIVRIWKKRNSYGILVGKPGGKSY
jgi:hypothetical protein